MAAFLGNVVRFGRIITEQTAFMANRAGLVRTLPLMTSVHGSTVRPHVCRCPLSTSNVYSRKPTSDLGSKSISTSPAVMYVEEEEPSSGKRRTLYKEILYVIQRINSQLSSRDLGRLFAIIHIARHQRKITEEDIVVIDRLYEADIGERIQLNKVMMVGGSDFTLVGRPVLSPKVVRVEAVILEKTLQHAKVWFAYKRRKSWRKMRLIRKPQTFLRISSIEVASLQDS